MVATSKSSSYELATSDSPVRGAIPERRLMAAILRRAVYDFVLYRDETHVNHSLALDSAAWLFCSFPQEEQVDGEWTFVYICQDLGLDPRSVRQRTLRLTTRDITRLSHHMKS